jgi:dienelactone hydrolase
LKDREYTDSVENAYAYLQEMLTEEGPFTGMIGFSHGATLAAMFLLDHAARNPCSQPWELVGSAVFIGAPSPFGDDGMRIEGEGREIKLGIPTVHVIGKEDGLYADAIKLYGLCGDGRTLVEHAKGHVVPRDGDMVSKIAKAIRDLRGRLVAM